MNNKIKLARVINRKMALYLILVLSIFTYACFIYINKSLKDKTLKVFIANNDERARFESKLFSDAENSMKLLEEQLFRVRRKRKQNNFDYQTVYDKIVPLRPDKKLGPHLSFDKSDINKEASVIVSTDYNVSNFMKDVFVDSHYVIENMGNAWKNNYFPTYLIGGKFTIIIEHSALVLDTPPVFSWEDMEIFKLACLKTIRAYTPELVDEIQRKLFKYNYDSIIRMLFAGGQ